MKIVVTGSLGHIGKPLTTQLVQQGHEVIVVSSNAGKQKDIEALGANAAIGSIEDVAFLTATFTGADAVYTMIPPPTHFLASNLDVMALCDKIGNNYARAVEQSGVKRLVHLSSIGAHLAEGSGLIHLHYLVEGILNKLTDVAITFMRPTAFYYNLLGFIPVIKNAGMIVSNYGGEDNVAWVSPFDIADAIADEITAPLTGRKIRYVASEELSCNKVAAILGTAIGKPDLQWVVISDEQMLATLEGAGLPKPLAAGLTEMQSCMHDGPFFEDYYSNRPAAMGKVKLEDYAKHFAAVYNQ